MHIYKNKIFLAAMLVAVIAFVCLFAIRLGLFRSLSALSTAGLSVKNSFPHEHESWMSIFQQEQKIGYSHKKMSRTPAGFHLEETASMRINTMGLVQDIKMSLTGELNSDFSMADFSFDMESGPFRFAVTGQVKGDVIVVSGSQAEGGSATRIEIPISETPYLFAGIPLAVQLSGLKPGERYVFYVFDPATMSQQTVEATVVSREKIVIMGAEVEATRISVSFKGMTQITWLDDQGGVLMEKGLLGMRMEKTSKELALTGIVRQPTQDLIEAASVAAGIDIAQPEALNLLAVEIQGVDLSRLQLDGGRQTLEDNILTVRKESLPQPGDDEVGAVYPTDLQPTLHIRSDHAEIQETAAKIIASNSGPLAQAQALADWVYRNIEKRPTLSIPDAVSTLENRVGDCNEHAVLLAALARSAGLPARIETGLVYLRGRFYYHAWNLVYVGTWISVDALFGQFPADVTHIRLASGFAEQTDLLGVIGNINLKIIRTE